MNVSQSWRVTLTILAACSLFAATVGNERSLPCVSVEQSAVSEIDSSSCTSREISATLSALQDAASRSEVFGAHGTWCSALRSLVSCGSTATPSIQAAIDQAENEDQTAYVQALYFALGFIRDPPTAPWLEQRLGKAPASRVSAWLSGWPTAGTSAPGEDLHWLGNATPWLGVLKTIVAREDLTRQQSVLAWSAVVTYCHDDGAVAFVKEGARSKDRTPEVALLQQAYLWAHGVSPSWDSALKTAQQAGESYGWAYVLADAAKCMPSEVWIPGLIKELRTSRSPSIQRALARISLRSDLTTATEWAAWYANRPGGERQAWIRAAGHKFGSALHEDPARAAQLLMNSLEAWSDIGMLPYLVPAIEQPLLHHALARWITSTYRPEWHVKLQEFAMRIIAADGCALSDEDRKRMRFLSGSVPSSINDWRDYVRCHAVRD